MAGQVGPHPVLDILFPEHFSDIPPTLFGSFVSNNNNNNSASTRTSLPGFDDPVAARRPHAVVRCHECRDGLAVALIRDTHDADLLDAGVLEQAILDLEGVDVLAAADNCSARC